MGRLNMRRSLKRSSTAASLTCSILHHGAYKRLWGWKDMACHRDVTVDVDMAVGIAEEELRTLNPAGTR
jgi:hypothetical protein